MLIRLKRFVKFDYVRVSEALKNLDFLEESFFLSIFLYESLVESFYCHQFLSEFVHGESDLAEGSFSQDLSTSVVLSCCFWSSFCLLKRLLDFVDDHIDGFHLQIRLDRTSIGIVLHFDYDACVE